jgi:hypothetical protein
MDIIKLLWTGGWDSTFRLLQAVLLEYNNVQPYYILSHGRKSLDFEKRTMALIKEELFSRYPDSRGRVLPTLYFDTKDIEQSKEITDNYRSVAARVHLGPQFDYLARFCFYQNLEKIELCIERGGSNRINRELIAYFKQDAFELDEKYSNMDVFKVFRYFRFPLINITKLDMKRIAKEGGFLDLLNMSWFCLYPVNGLPCGRCNPCVGVMTDGLGSRIPFLGHMRYYRRVSFDTVRDRLKRFPKIYQFLKDMKLLKKLNKNIRK